MQILRSRISSLCYVRILSVTLGLWLFAMATPSVATHPNLRAAPPGVVCPGQNLAIENFSQQGVAVISNDPFCPFMVLGVTKCEASNFDPPPQCTYDAMTDTLVVPGFWDFRDPFAGTFDVEILVDTPCPPSPAIVNWAVIVTPENLDSGRPRFDRCGISPLAVMLGALQDIIDANPNTALAKRVEDAKKSVEKAIQLLAQDDGTDAGRGFELEAMNKIAQAVSNLQAAVKKGLDEDQGDLLMDQLAGIAWLMAAEAVAALFEEEGDPSIIDEAADLILVDGDASRTAGDFKDAVSSYKTALTIAVAELLLS